MIYGHFCTQNSKIEAILKSGSMQVNDREGSGQPRVISGQIFELVFSNKIVSELVWCQDSKNVIFISMRCL